MTKLQNGVTDEYDVTYLIQGSRTYVAMRTKMGPLRNLKRAKTDVVTYQNTKKKIPVICLAT